jgi:hypothetical protein
MEEVDGGGATRVSPPGRLEGVTQGGVRILYASFCGVSRPCRVPRCHVGQAHFFNIFLSHMLPASCQSLTEIEKKLLIVSEQ